MTKSVRVLAAVFFFWLTSETRLRADAMSERRSYISAVQSAFSKNDFAALEKISSADLSTSRRTEDGLWFITIFHSVFRVGLPSEEVFAERERKLQSWIAAYPDSPTAHIAYAETLFTNAYRLRGEGAAYTVTAEGWKDFRDYIQRGRTELENFKSVSVSNPTWYSAMLECAKSQQWSPEDFLALMTEATQASPAFYDIYFTALNYIYPKWGGSKEEIAKFVKDAVRITKNSEGTGLYARIYWSSLSFEQVKYVYFYDNLPASWPDMKASFEDIVARYPSTFNVNAFASFACLSDDKATARMLLEKIGSDIIPSAWVAWPGIAECQAWATR